MNNLTKILVTFLLISLGNQSYSRELNQETINALAQINDGGGSTEKAFAAIEKNSKWVEVLMPGHLNELPVGMKATLGNVEYTIAVTKVEFVPDGAYISIFAKIVLPKTNKKEESVLFLGAERVRFYKNALVNAKLVLLADYRLPFKSDKFDIFLKGGFDKNTGNFGDLTYLEMDCEGPKQLKLSADVIFSRKTLLPLDKSYNVIKDEKVKVKSSFAMDVKDWNDMLITLNLPPFCSTKNQRMSFSVSQAVLDMSDLRNDASMVFDTCYNQIYTTADEKKLWRGFYCKAVTVVLPKEFKSKGSGERIAFGAEGMFIDNYGVTGNFFVTNILKIGNSDSTSVAAKNEGDASGWSFSIDTFSLKFELDHLKGGGFNGKIQLPVSKNGALGYRAYVTENDYIFAVNPGDTMDFAVFKAKMELYPSSTIIFEVKNDKFKPMAVLNGQILLNFVPTNNSDVPSKDSTKAVIRIPRLYFEGLTLITEDPYVSIKAAGYEGGSSMQRFPITIQKIGFFGS
ncbi:MAG: hypothetical protein HYZ42_10900 [Bacteroidetes bacterium]|nr:hypothetical protein [Bacteroidota bacterium]